MSGDHPQVVIYSGFFGNHIGGHEEYVSRLAEILLESGYQFEIITTKKSSEPASIYDSKVFPLTSACIIDSYPLPLPTFRTFRTLIHLLRCRYELAITHTRFFITTVVGAIICKLKGIPLLHVEHGSTHPIVRSRIVGKAIVWVDHLLGKFVISCATEVAGVSNACRDFLLHMGAVQSILLPNGIDPELANSFDDSASLERPDKMNLVVVGRLVFAKGIQDVIYSISRLRISFPDLVLNIVGDGPYRRNLEKLAEELGLPNVQFHGFLSRTQVLSKMRDATVLVNPSYTEGMPTTVLEAGLLGIPIVSSDAGGSSEVVTNGRSGFIYRAGDIEGLTRATLTLLEDKALRTNFAKKISLEVLRFSWSSVAQFWRPVLRHYLPMHNG